MQLEDVVFMDVFVVGGDGDRVTQQRKAGQRVIILRGDWNKNLVKVDDIHDECFKN